MVTHFEYAKLIYNNTQNKVAKSAQLNQDRINIYAFFRLK
jgi:hypothetical protein